MKKYNIGRIDDLPEGRGRAFQAGNRTIAVFRKNGRVFAVANRCSHKGASMCEGELSADGNIIRCPWHNWAFNLATGEHCLNPAVKLRTYKVLTEGDQVIVCM